MSDQPIADAGYWFASGALPTILQPIAILAIAILGLAMLRGYLPVRRGGLAILGCFVMFGSGTVATALVGGSWVDTAVEAEPLNPPTVAAPAPRAKASNPAQVDPYAGASLIR